MADTPAQAPPGNTRDTDERESYYLEPFAKFPRQRELETGWQRLIQQGQAGSLRNIMGSPKQT